MLFRIKFIPSMKELDNFIMQLFVFSNSLKLCTSCFENEKLQQTFTYFYKKSFGAQPPP